MEPSGESNAMARKTITDLPIFKLSQHANNDDHRSPNKNLLVGTIH